MSELDTALQNLGKTAVKVATEQVMQYLTAHVWAGFAYPVVGPVVAYLVSYVASILMERLDWVTYMVVENWRVTKEGQEFVETAEKLQEIEDSKDLAAIEKARKDKENAFRRLIGLGSPP